MADSCKQVADEATKEIERHTQSLSTVCSGVKEEMRW